MKKKNIILVFLLTVLFLAVGCSKNEDCKKDEETKEETKDYRDKWVGTWDFTTIDYVVYYHNVFDTVPTYVIDDTTHFIRSVEKYERDKLNIIFKPDAKEPDISGIFFPAQVFGLIYPIVDNSGNLIYPELRLDHSQIFTGTFSDNKISMRYNQIVGHFGKENHQIQGIKINKK